MSIYIRNKAIRIWKHYKRVLKNKHDMSASARCTQELQSLWGLLINDLGFFFEEWFGSFVSTTTSSHGSKNRYCVLVSSIIEIWSSCSEVFVLRQWFSLRKLWLFKGKKGEILVTILHWKLSLRGSEYFAQIKYLVCTKNWSCFFPLIDWLLLHGEVTVSG